MRPRVLIVNPNTSAQVTEHVRGLVEGALGSRSEVHGVTAAFGGAYIDSELSYAIGAHAAVDAYARFASRHGPPHAVLVACFGDPGVHALRSLTSAPVMGLAEASLLLARRHWARVAVVTGGAAWEDMLWRFARASRLDDALVQIRALPPSGAALAADPDGAARQLAQACNAGLSKADGVILGGAGLSPMAAAVRALTQGPLIDSVDAGLGWLQEVLAQDASTAAAPSFDAQAWDRVGRQLN